MAEGVGFEPTVAFTTPVFKTGLFVHSSTPPADVLGWQGMRKIIQGWLSWIVPQRGP